MIAHGENRRKILIAHAIKVTHSSKREKFGVFFLSGWSILARLPCMAGSAVYTKCRDFVLRNVAFVLHNDTQLSFIKMLFFYFQPSRDCNQTLKAFIYSFPRDYCRLHEFALSCDWFV